MLVAATPEPDPREGELRKRDQLQNLEARRETYVLRGRRALLAELLQAGTATADCVYAAVSLPPEVDPRCLGSVPGTLARAGIIRSAGFVKSNRPERHASYLQVWQLVDFQAAVEWLAGHPEPPAPPNPSAEQADKGFSSPINKNTRQRELPGLE